MELFFFKKCLVLQIWANHRQPSHSSQGVRSKKTPQFQKRLDSENADSV